uniref:Uncharacterized protein n=1 Tax=Oryza glaberrima TaxID=4538 RepID=I1QC08_ORYGL
EAAVQKDVCTGITGGPAAGTNTTVHDGLTSSSPCFSTGYNNQAWGVDSHPLGGFLNLLKKNTPSGAQVVINGSSSQPINVGDDTNVAIAEDLFASILLNAF